MKKLSVLLKTESMKLRRSPILLISFFAALLTAFLCFLQIPTDMLPISDGTSMNCSHGVSFFFCRLLLHYWEVI